MGIWAKSIKILQYAEIVIFVSREEILLLESKFISENFTNISRSLIKVMMNFNLGALHHADQKMFS